MTFQCGCILISADIRCDVELLCRTSVCRSTTNALFRFLINANYTDRRILKIEEFKNSRSSASDEIE